MPRKTKAQLADEEREARLREIKYHRDALCDLLLAFRRDYTMHWDAIGKAISLPGYCCMVLARQIKANREAPVPAPRRTRSTKTNA